MSNEQGAALSSPRHFMSGGSGKWAGEKMMAAILAGQGFTPDALRTLDVLQKDEWKHFDNVLVEGAVARLRGVSYFIGKGLVVNVPNSMAKTVYEYERVSDMNEAAVSLDGITRDMNDTIDFSNAGLPLPITHKDWYLNLRRLLASRERGEPLDTTHIRLAGRKIAEKSEEMLYQGGKTFGGLTIYGLSTHPDRNIASFGTNGAWDQAAKTGDNILTDVGTLLSAAQAEGYDGPYSLHLPQGFNLKLALDYKATGDKTIRQRLLDNDQITDIVFSDKMVTGVILVQNTPDVVAIINGETLQTVQWDIEGGFQINFKGFQIQVPLVRSNNDEGSGIVHMS